VDPAGLPQGLEHGGPATISGCQRRDLGAIRSSCALPARTVASATGVNGDQDRATRPRKERRRADTSSSAAAPTSDPRRPTSSIEHGDLPICSAVASRSRATRSWWARRVRQRRDGRSKRRPSRGWMLRTAASRARSVSSVRAPPEFPAAYLKASNTEAGPPRLQLAISGRPRSVVGAHGRTVPATGVNGDQSKSNGCSSFTRRGSTCLDPSGKTWGVGGSYLQGSPHGRDDQFGISVADLRTTRWSSDAYRGGQQLATGCNGSP